MDTNYAPQNWKKTLFDWDSASALEKAKERIIREQIDTDKGFQRVFYDFMKSTRDFHVSTRFYTTELTFVPIKVKCAEEQYFITNCNILDLENWHYGFIEKIVFLETAGSFKKVESLNKCIKKMSVGDQIFAINGVLIRINETITNNILVSLISPLI